MEQVVTTIATVANTAEEKFAAYYDRFMPGLKHIVQNANTQDYRLLRGKTIECISFIGLAVGKEKVRNWLGNLYGEMLMEYRIYIYLSFRCKNSFVKEPYVY